MILIKWGSLANVSESEITQKNEKDKKDTASGKYDWPRSAMDILV